MPQLDTELDKALSGKGWVFCGVWTAGTTAYVALDKKKPLKKSKTAYIKNEYGGKAFIQGACKVGPALEFRFVKGDKAPQKVHLKNGLAEQLDGRKCKVNVGKPLDEVPSSRDALKGLDS